MLENVRRVSSQLLAYGSADVAVLAINFLLLPLYTRVLTPEEYGVLALLLVCEAFLKVVLRWGLDLSFLRFHYDYTNEEDRRTLAGTITIFLLAVNGAVLAILVIAAGPLSEWLLGSRAASPSFILLLVNQFLSTFIFLPLSVLRIEQRAREFATLTFIRSFATIVARLVFVVIFRFGVFGIMLADVVVTVGFLMWFARSMRAMTAWRFSRPMASEVLRFGLPRVPQGLMHQGMAMSDRFFLGLYLPLAEVGIYLIATSIASLTKLYSVAFSTAWMPFAFDSMDRPDAPRLFARLGTYSFGVLVFVTLGVATLSDGLVGIMTPAAFHDATSIVPLLAVGIAIQAAANFLSTSLSVAKRSAPLPITTAIAAAVTIAGHLLLIPRWGIAGAAAAVCAGQVSLAIAIGVVAHRSYPIPFEWGRITKVALLGVAWYIVIVSLWHGPGLPVLAGRVAMLALFPLGLLAIRFFKPSELADLRQAAGMLRPRGMMR